MLDIIKNGLRNNDYYICLYPKHIYIYNYIEIITFTNEFIIISFSDFKLKIKGKSMHIKKMAHFELLIEGIIIGVNYE